MTRTFNFPAPECAPNPNPNPPPNPKQEAQREEEDLERQRKADEEWAAAKAAKKREWCDGKRANASNTLADLKKVSSK